MDIREYYSTQYPNCEFADWVNPITFEDLYFGLVGGKDVYDLIGIGDSITREVIFEGFAKYFDTSYYFVYKLWLNNSNKTHNEDRRI